MLRRLKREFAEGKTLLGFGILSAGGQSLGMIAPLVVAKFFSPALFGSYSLAKMVIFFFSAVLIGSSQTPFIVFANQERTATGKINKSFSVQCVFLISAIVLFAAGMLAFCKYVVKFADISHGDVLFLGLAFLGLALKAFLSNLFLATGERMKNAAAEMVFGSLSLALVFVFYFAGQINLRTVFLIYLISSIGLILIFCRAIDYKVLTPFAFESRHFREMFNFTKWVFAGAAAVYFVDWGDNIVLRIFVRMEDIGNYNFAYQIFKGLTSLTFIVSAYFLPFVSQNISNSEKMHAYFYVKRPRVFFMGAALIVLFFAVAPYAVKLIYGEVYNEAINVMRVLLSGCIVILFTIFYDPVLNAMKRYKFTQTVNVMQVLLNLGLDFALVPVMGLTGAAIATVVAYCCRAAVFEIYFRTNLKRSLGL